MMLFLGYFASHKAQPQCKCKIDVAQQPANAAPLGDKNDGCKSCRWSAE